MIPFDPTQDEIENAISNCSTIGSPKRGGMKIFYPVKFADGKEEALKLAYIPSFGGPVDSDSAARQAEVRKRVEREIRVLAESTSPFIVKLGQLQPIVVELRSEQFVAYSEELVDGNDLQVLIRGGARPDEAELRELALCMLDAIDDLWHNLGVVHRDIKPLNVMKTRKGERKFILLDLGIAYSIYETSLTFEPQNRLLPPGTPKYLAPEMFDPNFRATLDFRTDLYALGLTLFEYASGQHPLSRDKDDMLTTLSRIVNEQPKKLEEFRPEFSKDLTTMVNQLLNKLPALRLSRATTIPHFRLI